MMTFSYDYVTGVLATFENNPLKPKNNYTDTNLLSVQKNCEPYVGARSKAPGPMTYLTWVLRAKP